MKKAGREGSVGEMIKSGRDSGRGEALEGKETGKKEIIYDRRKRP